MLAPSELTGGGPDGLRSLQSSIANKHTGSGGARSKLNKKKTERVVNLLLSSLSLGVRTVRPSERANNS